MLKIILAFILFLTVMSIGRTDVKVNYLKLDNFTEKESVKIQKTAKVIEKVLNSQQFKDRVLSHRYKDRFQFIDTTMNNLEVYETIMRGAEKHYYPVANGNMDIGLNHYHSFANTIGYTYANSDTVWLNRKFHNDFDEYDQPSNIVHEWTHKLGFSHATSWSESRDYSVPYGIGTIVTELSKKLKENPNSLIPVTGNVELPAPIPQPEPAPLPVRECYRSWRTFYRLVCKNL